MLHQQSRSGGGGEPRATDRLRRNRPRGPELGHRSTPLCARCESLENDETLLVQSGKPVGIFRTHPEAPRVLIANSNLVGHWSNWDEFNRLEALGLTMYGQMTAGSWIYIGSQGIVQGTYETFAALARKHFGGSLSGRIVVSGGMGGMGGAQPSGGHHERRRASWASTSTRSEFSAAWIPATATAWPAAWMTPWPFSPRLNREGGLVGGTGRQLRRRSAGAGAARFRARRSYRPDQRA